MKNIHFLIGIFTIMTLYYLLTRNVTEGLVNSSNPDSCVPVNLGDPLGKTDDVVMADSDIASIASIAKMQAINQAIGDATSDMVRESAQTVRQIPLHPVPPVANTQEEISSYLRKINDSMNSLVATYSSTEDTSANLTDTIPNNATSTIIPTGNPFESMETMNQLSNTAFGDVSPMTTEEIHIERPYNRLTALELRKYFGTVGVPVVCPSGCVKPTKKYGNCTLQPPPPYRDGKKPHYVQCPWQCPDLNSGCKGNDKNCSACRPFVSFPLKDCSSYESAKTCNNDVKCEWNDDTGWCDEKGLKFSIK